MMTPKGFTLVEILIVVIILGIIAAIVGTAYSNFLDNQRMNEAVEGTISMFGKARNLTLASKDISGSGKQYGIKLNNSLSPSEIEIFEGATSIQIFRFPSQMRVSEVNNVPGGGPPYSFVFERLTGNVMQVGGSVWPVVGTIKIRSQASGNEKVLTIYPTGVIQVQ